MRKLGGREGREQIIIRETDAKSAADMDQANQGPSATEQQAAKMLVDAFGQQTRDPSPFMEQLASEFSTAQRGGARVMRPLERTPQGAIPHSARRFTVARDWDDKPEVNGFDLSYQNEYELDFDDEVEDPEEQSSVPEPAQEKTEDEQPRPQPHDPNTGWRPGG